MAGGEQQRVSHHLQATLVGLTAATGLMDATSYLGMSHVFVANMTGNIAFLGFAVSGQKGFSIPASLVALAGFLLGAATGGRLATALVTARRRWLTSASAIETALVTAAAIAVGAGGLHPVGPSRLAIIGMLGIGTGLQNATVRKLAVPDMTTTVLTLTITGLAADSSIAGGKNPRAARRIISVLTMLAGALAGGALILNTGFTTTLAVLAGVLAAVTFGFATLDHSREHAAGAPTWRLIHGGGRSHIEPVPGDGGR